MIWSALLDSISELRAFLYQKKICSQVRLPIPVVSVGNVTMGGTGKTPMIIHLLTYLSQLPQCRNGELVGVVVRSYKTSLKEPKRVELHENAAAVFGDEAVLIKKICPNVCVWAGPNKSKTAQTMFNIEKGLRVILLDDGLQHLALFRDMNIVLLDASVPVADYAYPPMGRRRESWAALDRGDWFVMTKMNQAHAETSEFVRSKLGGRQVLEAYQIFNELKYQKGQIGKSLDMAKRVLAFSGLAHSSTFLSEVRRQIPQAHIDEIVYRDHFDYDSGSLNELIEKAKTYDLCVTTEKDMVKLSQWPASAAALYVLGLDLKLKGPLDSFYAQIDSLFQSRP